MAEAKTISCGLAYYIRNELFSKWRTRREEEIDPKWDRNWAAFTSDTTNCETWKVDAGEGEDWRSDTFIQLTRTKAMTASSIVIDLMLQGGQIPCALVPSPLDNVRLDELPMQERKILENSISDMSELIQQQFEDSYADRQLMKSILAASIFGETYAKKIVHTVEKSGYKRIQMANPLIPGVSAFDRFEKWTTKRKAPGWKYISNWTVYRDLEVDDLQAGTGIIEREQISPYELRQKAQEPFFVEENIDSAIENSNQNSAIEGADHLPPILRDVANRKKSIDMLWFWGRVPTKVVREFEIDNKIKSPKQKDYEKEGHETEIVAAVAGSHVVRFTRAKPKSRPWVRAIWEDRLDSSYAYGVADAVEDIQKVLNGAVRLYEDNKKLAATVIFATKRRHLRTADTTIRPGLEIEVADDVEDVHQAISQIIIQDVGESLLNLIGLMERYADEASKIPRVLQGTVAEKQKPDTAFEVSQLQENAGKFIGRVIRNFDEGLIEPMAAWFYEYNMLDPDVKTGKGNYQARALGFTSFQAKVERVQRLMQALQLVLSNEQLTSLVKLRDLLEPILKGIEVEPSQVLKTDEEIAEGNQQQMAMAQQAQQIALQKEIAEIKETMAKAAWTEAKAKDELAASPLKQAKTMIDVERVKTERERIATEKERAKTERAKVSGDLLAKSAEIEIGARQ